MGLSAASMNPISGVYRSRVAQAYTVDNKADFSDAFVDSVKNLSSADAVEGAAPVQYPTAQIMTRRIGQIQDSQRVSQGLNTIASGFEGITTGYSRGGNGQSGYAMVGSAIDLFA